MMRALELRVRRRAGAFGHDLVERPVRNQRIDQGAVEPFGHPPEGGEGDGVLGLVLLDPGDPGLGDADPRAKLGRGHAQGFPDSLDPAARRAREFGGLAQGRETPFKLLTGQAYGGNDRTHMCWTFRPAITYIFFPVRLNRIHVFYRRSHPPTLRMRLGSLAVCWPEQEITRQRPVDKLWMSLGAPAAPPPAGLSWLRHRASLRGVSAIRLPSLSQGPAHPPHWPVGDLQRRERLNRRTRRQNLPAMKRQSLIALAVCAGAVALLAASELNRRDVVLYNATPSVPAGFYVRSDALVHEGAFVTVRAADVAGAYASLRHFTDDGDRFIKRVAARAGVRVCAEGGSVAVGAFTYARQMRDSAGRTLPTWEGCHVLHDGEVFLMGDTPDSFDSRYFGVVREDAIEGVWRPL